MATTASKTGTNDDNVIFGAGKSEVERLDMQHKVIYASMPQLIQAPIDLSRPGLRILDQATGSGIWLRDVREIATAAHTWVGTDIEDTYFPSNPPADMSYHHQSMTEPWPVDWNGTFDLVHSRMALPGVGTNPLENAVESLIALVKPGGWIQCVEMEWGNWDVGPAGQLFHDATKGLFSMVSGGQGVDLCGKLQAFFEKSKLQKTQSKVFTIATGVNAKQEIKEVSMASMFATATGVSETLKVLPNLGIPRERLDTMAVKLVEENRERGSEFRIFAIWAQKPIDA